MATWRCPGCQRINDGGRVCGRCRSPAPEGKGSEDGPPFTVLDWYRLLKFGVAGVACIALGIGLLCSPVFRQDPQVLSLADAMPGVAAILVGVVILGVTGLLLIRRR